MGRGVPELVLELNGRTWTLDPSRSYTLGRDPQGDMTIDDARVSWRHATISWNGRGWSIEDHGSTNGTYVQGRRVQQTEIAAGTSVRLGNATDGPRLDLTAAAVAGAPAPQARQAPAQQPQGAAAWPAAPAQQQQAPAHQAPQQPAWQHAPQQQPPVPHQQNRGGAPGAGAPGGGSGTPPVYGDRSPTTFHQLDLGRVMRIGRALEN
ncbi:FHA domain-containing protein, partial [[Kitasatospora] papulosa]